MTSDVNQKDTAFNSFPGTYFQQPTSLTFQMEKFILKKREPVPCSDLPQWAKWFETNERRIALTQIQGHLISTVFLGLNHRFGPGKPLLFETMIFDENRQEIYCERTSTWDEAEAAHNQAVGKLTRDNLPRARARAKKYSSS